MAIKPLKHKWLLKMREYEKKGKRTIKEQELTRQKITLDIAFRFLKIKVDGKS